MSKLPSSWEQVPLSLITEEASQRVPSADEQITYIDIGSVDRNSKTIVAPQHLLGADAPSRARKQVRSGDTLVSMTRPNLNAVALVPPQLDGQIASTGFDVLRPLEGIDPRWIAYLVRTEAFIDAMSSVVQGALYPAVRSKDVRAYRVPLAPSAEQTRIADQLDKLLARIQACNDRIDAIPALLKRFRQAVLAAAISGELSNEDLLPASVGGYPLVPLAEVAQSRLGKMLDRRKNSGVPTPYLGNINVRWFSFDLNNLQLINIEEHEKAGLEIRNGDVLICEGGEPGRCAIWDKGQTNIVFQKALHRVRPSAGLLSPQWLAYCIKHMTDTGQMRSLYTGTTIRHLTGESLAKLRLPLPNIEQQVKVVRRVEDLFKLADSIEARYIVARTPAQRLTPLLLAKAFRGELVQQDPQDEPASVLLERITATRPVKVQASRGRPRIQPKRQPAIPELDPINWASPPNGAWAAPADPDGLAARVWLTAVLRAWGEPMPEREARLAVMLCQQPRLFTAVLPAAQATQWSRLVGGEAKPLPAQVLPFQPAINGHWARAIKGMRACDDLIEAGLGDGVTWALGSGAVSIETAGWPDGRAGFVVAYLRAHGIASVLPLLESSAQEFVDARAA